MAFEEGSYYKTGRAVFLFLEVIGWLMVIVGVITALVGFGTGGVSGMILRDPPVSARFIATWPGFVISIVGLFSVAYVQSGRAQLHAAEYSREMLKLMRAQSRAPQASSQSTPRMTPSRTPDTDVDSTPVIRSHTESTPRTGPAQFNESMLTGMVNYKGTKIRYDSNVSFCVVGDKVFDSVAEAKRYIDGISPENGPPPA